MGPPSGDGVTWTDQVVDTGWYNPVMMAARSALVVGTGNTSLDVSRVALATDAIVQTVSGVGAVLVTPAGILDHGTGRLAPVTGSGIGAFADHGPAFAAGTVDGNRVALLVPDDVVNPGSCRSSSRTTAAPRSRARSRFPPSRPMTDRWRSAHGPTAWRS